MGKISKKRAKRFYDETVESKFAETRWPVYEEYELRGMEGFRHIWAPLRPTSDSLRKEAGSIDPFSPEHANLFLTFARWFDTHKMDKGVEKEPGYGAALLDTGRNGKAVQEWVHTYGVLGLSEMPSGSSHAVAGPVGSNSAEIAARLLGVQRLGGNEGIRAHRMSAEGGERETVEMFVFEAYEASVVLKLYEAASARTVSVPAISRFMSDTPSEFSLHLLRSYGRAPQTEREVWSQDEELAMHWALGVVQNAVNRKVEKDVYPILHGERASYKEGWGFKSLLGAMWLQMRWFMLGDRDKNFCAHCGRLFTQSRRDQIYCRRPRTCGADARARRQYERKKQRQQEEREATRRKLTRQRPPS